MTVRTLSPSCLAGPAWEAADARRRALRGRAEVAAGAIAASLDMLAEAGWGEEQLQFFVAGLFRMRAAESQEKKP